MGREGRLSMASLIGGVSHRGRVMGLYRKILETQRNWANNRALFCEEAKKTKAIFTERLGETEPKIIEQYIAEGEAMFTKYRHPDPYIRPTAFGGSKYMRNSPPPLSVCGPQMRQCAGSPRGLRS